MGRVGASGLPVGPVTACQQSFDGSIWSSRAEPSHLSLNTQHLDVPRRFLGQPVFQQALVFTQMPSSGTKPKPTSVATSRRLSYNAAQSVSVWSMSRSSIPVTGAGLL